MKKNKTSYWISFRGENGWVNYKCARCGWTYNYDWFKDSDNSYCDYCGAKMLDVKEKSEECWR